MQKESLKVSLECFLTSRLLEWVPIYSFAMPFQAKAQLFIFDAFQVLLSPGNGLMGGGFQTF